MKRNIVVFMLFIAGILLTNVHSCEAKFIEANDVNESLCLSKFWRDQFNNVGMFGRQDQINYAIKTLWYLIPVIDNNDKKTTELESRIAVLELEIQELKVQMNQTVV